MKAASTGAGAAVTTCVVDSIRSRYAGDGGGDQGRPAAGDRCGVSHASRTPLSGNRSVKVLSVTRARR
ncbi:hypothetical protein NCAST_23_01420 [Nocardia asteroides NBRC 15531]|uniref:Uncharacterized protein n=1 Tax=Nocardia asteroides NBRC 15531 TaxID=1110697 RepID=U5EGU4_NOCAS|nr:hypothetical protein NCAST_23_01420 [Nocardia asteroides NBRC 15531]